MRLSTILLSSMGGAHLHDICCFYEECMSSTQQSSAIHEWSGVIKIYFIWDCTLSLHHTHAYIHTHKVSAS